VAASMTGRCRRTDLVTFGLTEAALCDLCYARNHLGVELDEEGRALGSGTGPRVKADQLSYLIPSGRGGVRSNYATRRFELKNRTWLSNAITSGETPLDVNSKRQARTEGSQVRMIGQPVPPGQRVGFSTELPSEEKRERSAANSWPRKPKRPFRLIMVSPSRRSSAPSCLCVRLWARN
jgi:putative DNA primase/helicase